MELRTRATLRPGAGSQSFAYLKRELWRRSGKSRDRNEPEISPCFGNLQPMEEEKQSRMGERILELTLEIIYLLTGEDYTIVKKASAANGALCSPSFVSLRGSKTRRLTMEPPPHVITGRSNTQRILEVNSQIFQLLTVKDETPTGCKTEDRAAPGETYSVANEQCKKEQVHLEIGSDGRYNQNEKSEEDNVTACSPEDDVIALVRLGSPHLSSDSSPYKEQICDKSRPFTLQKPQTCPRITFTCSKCGKRFAWKSSLNTHEKLHTGERPYPCSECGKSFITRSHLDYHFKTHRQDKPFSCPQCGKRFLKKSLLVRHQRIHTGEKPFHCSQCGKSFSQKSHLGKHVRLHIREKPNTCSICGKCFTEKSYLVTHQIMHTGGTPFS